MPWYFACDSGLDLSVVILFNLPSTSTVQNPGFVDAAFSFVFFFFLLPPDLASEDALIVPSPVSPLVVEVGFSTLAAASPNPLVLAFVEVFEVKLPTETETFTVTLAEAEA